MDLAQRYYELTELLSNNGQIPDTVLHIHGGMTILLAVRVITGSSLVTPRPLLAVVFAALTKEFADFVAYNQIRPDTVADILNTIFWPAALFIGLRLRLAVDRARKIVLQTDHS